MRSAHRAVLVPWITCLALASGLRAADRFEDLTRETRVGAATLPVVRMIADAPFARSTARANAHLRRHMDRLVLRAGSQGQQELEVSIYKGVFPSADEVEAMLRKKRGIQLPTKTVGEPVFQRTVRYRKDVLEKWKRKVDAARRDPKLFLNRWARKNPQRGPNGYLRNGLQGQPLQLPGKKHSGIQHSVQGHYVQTYIRQGGDPLNPRGYGSRQDGFRPQPWAAARPAYAMSYETEVELPEPGVYVVVAQGEHTSSKSAFLYTEIENVVRRDGQTVHLQTVRRADGRPRPGVAVDAFWVKHRSNGAVDVSTESFSTDKAGYKRFQVPRGTGQTWLTMKDGKNRFFLSGGGFVQHPRAGGQALFHLTTDRQVYKPGETVKFRGVVRTLQGGVDLDVVKGKTARVQLGWQGKVTSEVTLSDLGTFHGELELPRDQRTGTQNLRVNVNGVNGQGSHRLEVLAYRKPEHEVLVEAAEPYTVQGDTATVKLHGRFTVGGNLGGAKVRWRVRPSSASSSPHGGLVSGRGEGGRWRWRENENSVGARSKGEAVLDSEGRYRIRIPVPRQTNDHSLNVHVDLISPDGRTVQGQTSFYAPRSEKALGLKTTMSLVEEGEDWVVLARCLDLEGKPRSADVKLKLQRRRWERRGTARGGFSWHEVIDPIRDWTEAIDRTGKAQWKIKMPMAGNIELIARTKDAAGRETSSKVTTYRFGSEGTWWRWDRLELSADKDEYRPGETARVLLRCPLEKGTAWWSMEGEGLRLRGKVEVAGYNALIQVPLVAADIPEAKLHVEVVKNGKRLTQDLNLEVPARERRAEVTLTTDARVYQPGDTVTLDVTAVTPEGRGVAGELCLAVVDEALDQVATDHTRDLYDTFYGTRWNKVAGFGGYWGGMPGGMEMQLLGEGIGGGMAMADGAAPAMAFASAAPADGRRIARSVNKGGVRGGGGGGGGGIRIRKDFRDVAHWVGAVRTDGAGKARLSFQLPDDLARWKLVAYWVDAETRIDKATHRVIARKDLMVRLGLPRFLTTGDHILVKASVQNVSEEDRRGTLTFETKGAQPVPLGKKDLAKLNVREDPRSGWLVSDDGPVKKAPDRYELTVPRKGHDAVDFPIFVHGYPSRGKMTFESIFDSEGQGDGLRKDVPVVPFARRKTEVTIHKVKEDARIPIEQREGTFRDATEVGVDLMLGLDQAVENSLVDDLNMLIGYRYGCTEQTLSRFVPLASAYAALGEDWLVKAGVERAGELEAILDKGIERLRQLRKGDGWGWAPGNEASSSITSYLILRLYRLPEPYRSRVVKELDLPRAVRWLKRLFEANSEQALDREEKENDAYRMLSVYRAFEALAVAGQKVKPPRLPGLKKLAGDPRFWTCYGSGALALGRDELAQRAAKRLMKLSDGNKAFRHWRHQGIAWSWYADDTETSALVLEFLQAEGERAGEWSAAFEPGLRWMVMGQGATRYRSTKGRAVSVAVGARRLKGRKPSGRRDPAKLRVIAHRTHERTVSPKPRAVRNKVIVRAPELVRAGHAVEIVKESGPGVLARLETTRYVKGPFRPEDNGFGVRSKLELSGEIQPSHRDMKRIVEFEVREAHRYAILELPLISGAEVPTKGDRRPALWRRNSRSKWYRSWQEVDVLDDRVVFYFQYLSPGRYRAEVTMNPEIAGYHNMLPARLFLMYFPHVEGTSESHRVQVGRE